jgi:hypothetical protein
MSPTLEATLSNHFKGLKRKVAETIQAGVGSCKVGKDPLSFSLYQYICKSMIQTSSRDVIFARTVTWNLMCRASNTLSIQFDHIEFKEDALCIYFARMKND